MTSDDEVQRINTRKFEEMMKQASRTMESRPSEYGKPIELSDATFHETVKRHPVMVVDFWAPWCGPCKVVSPVLEQLASEMEGKATFAKLNVDDNPTVSQEFQIQGIPTILIFKDGEPVDGLVGAAPKAMIESKIKPHLGASKGSPYQ